ncbi:proton-conducting transporter membrane subunit [Alkalimonas collagenimarina]|uniref:Proton-conducting transporter membrane subunit n=1 Tax=Alkalimonas collagenimarina TaxID=400390 RepID=A0ABT9GYU1_9GAMM|nr:proton-conducting transporter membrane subunit [Alkalimonas collagenimarina]MDP4536216.1 proton-conducting transporter membrane subunit [Alkalimonas collagenimarina]
MDFNSWLPLLIVLSSLIPGLLIFTLAEHRTLLRTCLNLSGVVIKLLLVVWMWLGVKAGEDYFFQLPFLPGGPFILHGDALSLQFVMLSSVLWLATTVYAIGYLENSPLRSRFFGYFSLCVSATVGLALSGNLVTFVLFYELLTLATFPLVVHRGTPQSLRAGRRYLAYTISGGVLLLMGAALLHSVAGSPVFMPGGYLSAQLDTQSMALIVAFVLLIAGLGVKAALLPLHGWLPEAMVAPAPVSALLHAVAVVKAGAFGIVRVVYDVFGVEVMQQLDLTWPLVVLASSTILYGSWRALQQQDIKRRLAYSTVSQVSYVTLGVAMLGPVAAIGGLVHLVHQGVMKITLFFCAGNYAETLGIHKVHELNGVGRRMPLSSVAFSLGALGMIGIPPTAGMVSKWYLSMGALEAGFPWVLGVLLMSSALNAAYFLPLLYRIWCLPAAEWPEERRLSDRFETHWMLLLPPVLTGALIVLMGVLAGTDISPLSWTELIVEREFGYVE